MRNSIHALLACVAASLVACGGGSSDPGPGSLSGLAATGAAIAGGSVTARCVKGPDLTGTTDANGNFNLQLTQAHTAPCMLKVTGGSPTVTLHSFATAAGQVNISPITDLVLAKALGSDPAAAFTAFDSTHGSTIAAGLSAAKTYVTTQVNAITGATPSADPMSGKFVVGDADDKVLDALAAALASASKTLADLRSGAATGATLTATVPAWLAAPTGASATAASASQINLNWNAVTGASGYHVYRSTSPSVALIAGNRITTSALSSAGGYADTGLSASTAYYYKVVAINAAVALGLASAEVSASTSALTAPAAPTGVSASASSASQITVNWSAVSGATGYNVYRASSAGGTPSKITASPVSTAGGFVDTGLAAGTIYSYTVKAVNASGEGAASSEASATTSAATGGSGGTGGTGGGTTSGNPSAITVSAKSPAVAADIASMVGHYVFPEGLLTGGSSLISDCTLDVAANGTFTLAGGGYSYSASVTGKTYLGFTLDAILGTSGNYTVVGFNGTAGATSMSTVVQNGGVTKVTAPGLTCALANPKITTTTASTDNAVTKHATASNFAASHVGTYRNADNCQLVITSSGNFHFTLPAAATLASSVAWNGSKDVAANANAIDVSTVLGGDFSDKMGGVWVTYPNGIGGNVQIEATDVSLLTGNFATITFYQSVNLAGVSTPLSTTISYLETPSSQLSTIQHARCDNMLQQ